MKKNRLSELLGIEYPVIQAPMDWITNAELVASVSNAGGLGVIGPNAGERTVTQSVSETGDRLRRQIRKVKALTDKPFGVNLIVFEAPDNFPGHAEDGRIYSDECLKVILEEGVHAAVLAGNGPGVYTGQLKEAGIRVLFRAMPSNVSEAQKAENAGVDAFIAVGFEGGGHTGIDRIPTLSLVPQVADAVKIPVVAGGGIADGRGMAAAMALGAKGVFMGTRFIATSECPAHQVVKRAILDAGDNGTSYVTGIPGVLRALKSPLMDRCVRLENSGADIIEVTKLYHSGYMKGMLEGDWNEGTFVCGAAAGMISEVKSASRVVQDIIEEAGAVIHGL